MKLAKAWDNLLLSIRTALAPKHLQEALYELDFLKRNIKELGDYCAYDSPEIGHATNYLLKNQVYPQSIVAFRDDLRRKKLTLGSFMENNNKIYVIKEFNAGRKGVKCKCGFYEASHYKNSLEWDATKYPCSIFKLSIKDESAET